MYPETISLIYDIFSIVDKVNYGGIMGMFNSKTEEQKIHEALEKYGLNINPSDITDIKRKNVKNIQDIAKDLVASGWFKAGMAFSFASADKQATVGYLSAIFNQNWILIRQNEIIIKLLEEINTKDK